METRRCLLVAILAALALIFAACAAAEPVAKPEETPAHEGEAALAPEEPVEEEEPTLAPPPTEPPATPTAQPSGPTPIPTPVVEERIAEVEWPASMRVGDGEVIRLSLVVSPEGAYLTTPEIAGHAVETTTLPLPVTRSGYQGYVNASLTAAGLEVTAAGASRQALRPGRTNTWRWTVSAPAAGTYHPVINLIVSWEPESRTDGAGPIEEAVWSRVLTVEARAPLGLSGSQIDWLGLGGTALGTAAGLPFVEKALSTLWKRLRGQGIRTDG
jgi:hypothetical protein